MYKIVEFAKVLMKDFILSLNKTLIPTVNVLPKILLLWVGFSLDCDWFSIRVFKVFSIMLIGLSFKLKFFINGSSNK